MNASTQRLCIWSAPLFSALFFIGFGGFAGFLPPPSPDLSAASLAQLYQEHRTPIRIGLVISAMSSALLLPWFAVFSVQLKRIEGRHSPMAYLQMIAGALAVFEFIFPLMILQAAAFRADRSPEGVQLLNDLAWIPFVGIVSTAIVQGFAIAIPILKDSRSNPVFPRWSGYFNIWVVSMLAGGGLNCFFKTGPFAWDGLLAFWLVVASYWAFLMVNTVLLLRAVKHQEGESLGDAPPSDAGSPLAAEVAALRMEVTRLHARIPA